MPFKVGDRVQITGSSQYSSGENFPSEGTGTVIYIRNRYAGSPAEYYQYQLHVDGYDKPRLRNLKFYYDQMHVQKI